MRFPRLPGIFTAEPESHRLPLFTRRYILATDFAVMLVNTWIVVPVLLCDSGFTVLQCKLFEGVILAVMPFLLFYPAFTPSSKNARRWAAGSMLCCVLFTVLAAGLYADYNAAVLWENLTAPLPLPARLSAAAAIFCTMVHLCAVSAARRQYIMEMQVFYVPGQSRLRKPVCVENAVDITELTVR